MSSRTRPEARSRSGRTNRRKAERSRRRPAVLIQVSWYRFPWRGLRFGASTPESSGLNTPETTPPAIPTTPATAPCRGGVALFLRLHTAGSVGAPHLVHVFVGGTRQAHRAGRGSPCIRAATFTPSPSMSLSLIIASLTCTPIRKETRGSLGISSFTAAIRSWMPRSGTLERAG